LIHAIFIATALSISAMPVTAKIFRKHENRKNALQAKNHAEFLSLIKSGM
jgi:hypothetical protein